MQTKIAQTGRLLLGDSTKYTFFVYSTWKILQMKFSSKVSSSLIYRNETTKFYSKVEY